MKVTWNHQGLTSLKAGRYLDPKGNRLALVVTNASKTWTWQARVNGVPRTLTLGKFPTMGLAEARARAGEIQSDNDEGIDVYVKYGAGAKNLPPEAEQGPIRPPGIMTCQEAWDRYIGGLKAGTNVHGKASNKPRTIIEKEGMWTRLWEDEIGSTLITEVTEDTLYDTIAELREEGFLGAANSTTRYIKAFFQWARRDKRATGLRINIAEDLPLSETRKRDRRLSDSEIRWLWSVLEGEDEVWADAYRLALLTGQRKLEIFGLRRDEVNMIGRNLAIRAERMKHSREHVVPLPPESWKIVDRRLKGTNSTFLFPNIDGDNYLTGWSNRQANIKHAVSQLAAKHGHEVAHWMFHDLRRSFSSHANGLQDEKGNRLIAKDHIERVLSHVIGGVEGTYDRNDYYAEKLRALSHWEDHLMQNILGKKNMDLPMAA